MTAPFSRFMKQRPGETVVFRRVIPGGGRVLSGDRLVVEIWSVRREEERIRNVRSRARVGYDDLSINVLELIGIK